MKKLLILLIFLSGCVICCCKDNHTPVDSLIKATLNNVIENWSNNLCDYPKSLDEFVMYAEKHDNWKNQPIKDSLQSTLTFLTEEKKHITWNFSYPTVTTMDLTILYYNDTIYRKSDKLLFPGLEVSLYSYNWYHLEYPDSIEELIAYDSLSHCLHQGFFQCCDVTFDYLLKNKDKMVWRKGEGNILIMAGNDTIAYQGDDPQIQYCDDSVISNKNIFRFFDKKGRYAYSEELEKNVKTGLIQLRAKYINAPQEIIKWHVFEYTLESGLRPFCKNDDIKMDTDWFKSIEDYMYIFCCENDLSRVVFIAASY